MSIPYELGGRTRQKRRTRDALVTAARELVAHGKTPTVDEAATKASVSRTTAYRYFPNQRTLLVAAHPEIDTRSLLPDTAPTDVAGRLDAVITSFLRLIVDTESQQRTMLRLSLDPDPSHRGDLPLRKGRAIGWIGEALAPLRGQLTESDLRRLTLAIRSAAGIEPLVWLTDIAGLSRREAVQLMRWSASALLRSALAESDTTGLKVKPRRPVEGITRRKSSSGTPNPALSRRRRA
ncbi:MAG TPA: TetR/AcrR family transcriptional regulator [Candidatus Dormibacteraeota bacterium]|nr:TetR/AcrR family transcriptional regulator [Candidatus Dormibacteraeota bacterium]